MRCGYGSVCLTPLFNAVCGWKAATSQSGRSGYVGGQEGQERWLSAAPRTALSWFPAVLTCPGKARRDVPNRAFLSLLIAQGHPHSFPREQREQDPGSVAGAGIRAPLRAACAASGIPAWPRVPGHLSPPARLPPAQPGAHIRAGRSRKPPCLNVSSLLSGLLAQPWRWLQPGRTRLLLGQSQEGPRIPLNCDSPVLSTGTASAWWPPLLPPSIAPMLLPCSDFHGQVCWGAGSPARWEPPAVDTCFGSDLPPGTSIFPHDSWIRPPLQSGIPVRQIFSAKFLYSESQRAKRMRKMEENL